MKTLTVISIAAFAACTTQAMAAGTEDTPSTTSSDATVMTQNAVGAQPATGMESGAPMGKTRAEVYQELLRAQKDGTLDRLNALYGGGQ
ncbi:DUF4148 domain-containing protein [Trinickia symbiotica]|nr:DUF4148 domain-containing protein [Trinickia symbiotica]